MVVIEFTKHADNLGGYLMGFIDMDGHVGSDIQHFANIIDVNNLGERISGLKISSARIEGDLNRLTGKLTVSKILVNGTEVKQAAQVQTYVTNLGLNDLRKPASQIIRGQ
jgi:hypothetical protein